MTELLVDPDPVVVPSSAAIYGSVNDIKRKPCDKLAAIESSNRHQPGAREGRNWRLMGTSLSSIGN
jgi:hypothetical protein